MTSPQHLVPPDVLHGPRLDVLLVTVEQLLARAASDGPVPLGFADPADTFTSELSGNERSEPVGRLAVLDAAGSRSP